MAVGAQFKGSYSVSFICETLGLPRSSFYQFLQPKESRRTRENRAIDETILRIYGASNGILGAPKIHQLMRQEGWEISLKRVQKRMRLLGIRSVAHKKFRAQSAEKTPQKDYPNLLNQAFRAETINQKWVADITYIHTQLDGWCYLSSIQDLHTRKIIAWTLAKTMTEDLVLHTLHQALEVYQWEKGHSLIFHTDRGRQYTGKRVEEVLKKAGIQHSYSKKGNPYDNATIESFHAQIKKEEVYRKKYRDFYQAKMQLFRYIEGFYNQRRPHSSIGYLTPNQKELESLEHF
jgi:transposase InsO family protein